MQKIITEKVSPYINCIYKMITARSKGSETNLTQILFSLGNQNVDGRRCPLGFNRRALPHFSKDDHSPGSRGFGTGSPGSRSWAIRCSRRRSRRRETLT